MGRALGHPSAPDLAEGSPQGRHAHDRLPVVSTNIFRNKKDFIFNQISSGSQGLAQNHKPVLV